MFQNKNTGKKLAVGTIFGGIVGYVAGLLTAPQSGAETREDIVDQTANLKDDTSLELSIAYDKLSDVIKRAQKKAVTLSAQAREEFNESLIRAKDAQTKAKVVLKAVKSGGSDNPELNRAVKQAKQATKNLGKFMKS